MKCIYERQNESPSCRHRQGGRRFHPDLGGINRGGIMPPRFYSVFACHTDRTIAPLYVPGTMAVGTPSTVIVSVFPSAPTTLAPSAIVSAER